MEIGINYLMLDDKMTTLDYYLIALEFYKTSIEKKPLSITNYVIGLTYSFLYSYKKSTTYLLQTIENAKPEFTNLTQQINKIIFVVWHKKSILN